MIHRSEKISNILITFSGPCQLINLRFWELDRAQTPTVLSQQERRPCLLLAHFLWCSTSAFHSEQWLRGAKSMMPLAVRWANHWKKTILLPSAARTDFKFKATTAGSHLFPVCSPSRNNFIRYPLTCCENRVALLLFFRPQPSSTEG